VSAMISPALFATVLPVRISVSFWSEVPPSNPLQRKYPGQQHERECVQSPSATIRAGSRLAAA
jgi:hypothetical protein